MRKTQNGMSLAEVLVGLAILSIMILTTITATTTALRLTKNNVNKEFATQKAISMLEELRSLVQTASGSTLTFLDAYDDGTENKFILTTQNQIKEKEEDKTQPADLISGNVPRGSGWLYERRISVQPVPGQGNDVRFVNVKVFINEEGGQRLLAEVASVLRTLVVDMPPTQVYDVYAVAVENVPGWWVYMSNIVPFVRTTIADLQARNPGLIFRTHWIHTLAYGRDWQYKPYTNDANPSTNDINWAYFYPGKMPATTTAVPVGDDYYYPWFLFRAVMNRDGTTENGYLDDTENEKHNPWPYAIADNYNNAMRYPDELAYYAQRREAAAKAGKTEELTWRLLIEQMYSNPSDFTNAIVINLHGELLPFPPVRNYSDAAKSPETYPRIRAVTHPEQLRYTNNDDVKLRVYTYRMDPENTATGTNYFGDGGANDVPVTVRILGTKNWTTLAANAVQVIRGGTDQDGNGSRDKYDAVPINAPTAASGQQMYYKRDTSAPTNEVVLELYKSPLKHPQDGFGGGLASRARLYGLEYIPAPLEDLTQTLPADQFKRHLGSTCCPLVSAFRDNFTATGYGQNIGTVLFSGNWDEDGDDDSATAGRIQIVSNAVRIGDNGDATASQIWRNANLFPFDTARVSFNWVTAGLESNDEMIFEVSKNNGGNWREVGKFTGITGAKEGFSSFDVTGDIALTILSGPTRFRFRPNGNYSTTAPQDFFTFDNFQVEVTKHSDLPKNTARWIITIPKGNIDDNPDQPLTIETRIGKTVKTGVMYPVANDPPNLSRTYVWVGDDDRIFGTTGANGIEPSLPITEQFQFMGDPRHLPYADLKRPHIGAGFGAAYENRLGMGYNRYHDDFEAAGSGNLTTSSLTAVTAQNYTFGDFTNTFAVIVNGTTNVSVALPKVTAQTATNVATTLNADTNFKAVAFADVTNNRLRITSKNKGGSIQYDNVNGNNGAIFGFEGSTVWSTLFTEFNPDINLFTTGAPWPGWSYRDADGTLFGVKNDGTIDNDTWHDIELDVPRAFQMLRSGLTQSSVLWTTMTGFSYYYMGVGNEIGYDAANNFTNSIPVSTKPYTGSGGQRTEQTIIDWGVKYIRQQQNPPDPAVAWWSIYWIGELYPDSQYTADSNWKVNGNLRTGTGLTSYVRDLRENMPTFTGTKLMRSERRTNTRGSTTLFWGGTTTSTFHHTSGDGDSKILDDGKDIRNNYALPVPDKIPTNRPWAINANATVSENFLTKAYPTARKLQLMQRYFEREDAASSSYDEGSALVAMTDPLDGKPAFIIVNGLSPTGITGTTFIAKWSFLTLIQSFLNGGMFNDGLTYVDPDGAGPLPKPVPGKSFHVRQLPRVIITEPNQNTQLKDPGSIKIAWEEKWTRWDGGTYSRAYPAGCQDTTEGCYKPASDYKREFIVLYSPSNGAPDPEHDNPTGWFYTDGSVGTLGARDLDNHGIDELEYT
ncbi:MAG TPA: hypothetical protein VGQ76_17315, partial [Thermoanaerobaculia bacterium]|nr:hypothetical protein [Thermoanaerobaculia bacterium]